MANLSLENGRRSVDIVDLTISDDDDGEEAPPPPKRIKIAPRPGPNERFSCLTQQVFPHLQRAVQLVERADPGRNIKSSEIESEVRVILTLFGASHHANLPLRDSLSSA